MSPVKGYAVLAVLALAGLASADSHDDTATICAVQGTGSTPSFLGSRVALSGVVTADFQASLGGFFLQAPGCDSDPLTSDGIWVSGRSSAAVVGHRVTVSGQVAESYDLTTLVLESATDAGSFAGTLEALTLDPPADAAQAAAYLEAREGMLVALPPSRVVAATDHYGEAYLVPESSGLTRLYQGSTDGRKLAVSQPDGWLALRHGDRVTSGVGPLSYTYGQFKVLLSASRPASVAPSGTAWPTRGASAGLSVATYNLENLFDAVDDPGKDDAPSTPTAAQYAVDLAKRARSIASGLGSPDVLVVEEVENLGVLQDLAAQPELVPAGYRAVLVEGPDSRGIDVGVLYRGDRVTLRSAEARQGCTDVRPPSQSLAACTLPGGGTGSILFARPPLVVKLEDAAGRRLTVVGNHFLAQSEDAHSAAVRAAQADGVRALVAELRAQEPDAGVIVAGDLNDFEDSDTLLRMTSGGALVDPLRGRADRPYTHAYRGLCQTLDYLLLTGDVASRVRELGPVHVNVDFAAVPAGAAADATPRVSDHDPVLVVLD